MGFEDKFTTDPSAIILEMVMPRGQNRHRHLRGRVHLVDSIPRVYERWAIHIMLDVPVWWRRRGQSINMLL